MYGVFTTTISAGNLPKIRRIIRFWPTLRSHKKGRMFSKSLNPSLQRHEKVHYQAGARAGQGVGGV